jgi:hypothetical protein
MHELIQPAATIAAAILERTPPKTEITEEKIAWAYQRALLGLRKGMEMADAQLARPRPPSS